ncbi:BTAD domain-containing putative transcriptional regulator [Mycolicibacterium porcinum]|uniref:BTAD domain-containing putative transcriptional regulator n=1 Tax=Mycolicibacterium porcinum TaxID=39693 RepID=UPI003D9B88B1
MELGVLGPLQVRKDGAPVVIPGAKPRAILTMLGLHGGSVVPADVLTELLWGDDPPRTAAKALQTHISSLRHTLGDGFVLTEGAGWRLNTAETDAARYQSLTKSGRDALAAGDIGPALIRFDEAAALWRGAPELPDDRRGVSERTRWIEAHAALVEDRADALLATGRAAEIIGDLEAAVADAPLRERRWGQLMLALYRAGRQGEALGAYRRARSLLADELGVDPGPELRRLEAAIVAQDAELDIPATQHVPSVTRAVTFLLTDIEGSTAAWEVDARAMAVALARHDELVEQVITSRGGRLIKTRGEGDATFSVFERPSAAAAAAIELQDAIFHEPWALAEPIRIRIALHTGEAELRDGDYFGRAVNRAARLRSQASGGQILCSGATAELVIDSLSDDIALLDLGMRQLKNLARPEHIFELRLQTDESPPPAGDTPIERPMMPTVLGGPGPFVGRGRELAELLAAWQSALTDGTRAVLIAGEPGVGKTRLAGEWSRQAYEQGAVVLYGRSDEDLGAPYQPFAEALRTLVPCIGPERLRGMRGIEALLPLVPGLTDVLPDLVPSPHGDPDTERYALFDAAVALLGIASMDVPIVLVLDDLHWAAKPTLLLLRHLLRFGEHARVQIIGTYRSTDLDRSHPLAAMLADLHRDGSANRIALGGLGEDDVTAYVAGAGYDDHELARALASVTGGNPFFLIEALRHVDESGGHWDPSTLPQGVREAVSRRLSRLPVETNKALAAAAVVGSQFSLDLVEQVVGQDLVDPFDAACQAGILIEEPGGRYRFNHAIVRQSLLAELASVRRMRLHQRIAATLETMPGASDELLADLAHHYFECAWAGNAVKAVEYCRRAADQAMARLAYEGAADLFDHALHALDELDDELPDRDDQRVELLVARCEALLAAGDVSSAAGAVSQLQAGTGDSARLAAWATCFHGQLSMLVDPERLDEIEVAVSEAAEVLAESDDAAGEAKAYTVRAGCLARLGRVADCELALDNALSAARRAGEHRLVNAVLAGAPLAALWGPNPVPRAGGRCLDVVRLLRITTDSPAVEATSTRCQAVLEAFRGRAAAARRMIESARRTVTELGLRHALLEVEHFAGIAELVLDDPAAAEEHLRLAYNGFRRMGLDADTAETAALLARACLRLDRDVEAEELCSESERLAGHALKAAIAWRTVRAQLLSRGGSHEAARRVAEEAVAIAERTDALVDHGDACLALATVLGAAGDDAGAHAAADRAAGLYEQKGAVALAERARGLVGTRSMAPAPTAPARPEAPVEIHTAAIRTSEQATAFLEAGAWDEFEGMFAPGGYVESRRKLVGFARTEFSASDVAHQTRCDLENGIMRAKQVIVAARGEHFALARVSIGTFDESPGAPEDEFLQLYGIDEGGRIVVQIWFDLDDMDAALAELDTQYARFVALQPYSETTISPDTACVRAAGRVMSAYERAAWDEFEQLFAPEATLESRRKVVGFAAGDLPSDWVHQNRLNLEMTGMRVTATDIATRGERLALARLEIGTSDLNPGAPQDELLQLYGIDEVGRVVLQIWFDVDDMDTALAELDAMHARFGERRTQTPRLENAASQVYRDIIANYAVRDWEAIRRVLAENISTEDRRRVVNAGPRAGRDAVIAEISAISEVGVTEVRSDVIATRGTNLVLCRSRAAASQQLGAFHSDLLEIIEVNSDNQVSTRFVFDVEDVDAAFAELEARYLAGEAAPYARTWATVIGAYAAFNRREIPPTTPDWVNIDKRHAAATFAPGEMVRYIQAAWEDSPDTRIHIESVHRLTDRGAVVTHFAQGVSHDGFAAESRDTHLLTVDGEMVSRSELFDAEDLDAALARFDALSQPVRRLENAASRATDRFMERFAARDWDAAAEAVTDDISFDDRRRVINADLQIGRESFIENFRIAADLGATQTPTAIATRGERVVLTRARFSLGGGASEEFGLDLLHVIEVDADDRIAATVTFDPVDFDAAIAELDTRYLAGESVDHAHAWTVIAQNVAAFNRREPLITAQDWVTIDHRRATAFEPGDITPYIHATWDVAPDINLYIETPHRLSASGALFTQVLKGTSHQGFDAEWRDVIILTVDGEQLSGLEVFDESDLDAALARFDELSRPAPQPENAASQAFERFFRCFATGDWAALAEMYTEDTLLDDRRAVVGSGQLRGREVNIANMRAVAEFGVTLTMSTTTATRGTRLALTQARFQRHDPEDEPFYADMSCIVETDDDDRISALVTFDPDDVDSAFQELDARYLAGEAAAHASTWSLTTAACAALNRYELPSTTADFMDADHRRAVSIEAGGMETLLRTALDHTPVMRHHIEAVHRLTEYGSVITQVARGTSDEGFDAEWRIVGVLTIADDLINRCEVFDETSLDAALARFDELGQPPPT